MANYLKHVSCDNCGSSDGKALYDDGSSFCFVCRKPSKGTISPYLLERKDSFSRNGALPSDINHDYPEHVLNWVFKYSLTVVELIKHNVYYSKYYDQLIFTWWGPTTGSSGREDILLWQGRNFRPDAKSKCYTCGEPERCLPLYSSNVEAPEHAYPLVLCEDPISAIKIARLTHSMPVLGSDLSANKLARLSHLPEASRGIVVWLDGNMFHKGQRIAQRLQMLGLDARAVYTELDPKCYSDEQIKEICM